MDPTNCLGQMGVVKGIDLAAFDAIGWNLGFDVLNNPGYQKTSAQIYLESGVPEATTWAMLIAGFGFIGASLRRRKQPALATA